MKDIVITLLVAILLFFVGKCSTYIKDEPLIVTKTDTVYQQKTFTRYKKGDEIPFYVIDSVQIPVHDTIQILADYSRIYAYSDTIHADSNTFYIQDTITQNKIQGRGFKADLHEKTILVTNNIYHKDKNALYLGFLGDLRRFDNKVGLGVGLVYKMPKSAISLNLSTNTISLGIYKKIF
jgi:predicted GNAT family acetyltransferase